MLVPMQTVLFVNFPRSLLAKRGFCFILCEKRPYEGGNAVTTKKSQKIEAVLCVLLTLIIIGAAAVGYTHRKKLWIFAEEVPVLGFPVEMAITGGAEGAEPA